MHTVIDLENGNCLVVGEFNREIINDNGVKLVGGEPAVVIAKVLLPKDDEWKPIETAPRGGGADDVRSPNWIEPPKILLRFPGGEACVAYWEWSRAEGGYNCTDGVAWVEPISGEQINAYLGEPTHWRPLPAPPASTSKIGV